MTTIEVGQDIVDVAQALLRRVYTLEQRITSPSYVVPNGSSPTFKEIVVGDWSPDSETTNAIPIQSQVGSPTNLTLTTTATFEDVSVDASWMAPADGSAASYEVLIALRQADGSYVPTQVVTVVGTNAHFGGLLPNRVYGVNVKAINRIGVISTAYPAAGMQEITTGKDATIPGGITGLKVDAAYSSVTLQWDESTEGDVAGGSGQYQVQQADDEAFTVGLLSNSTSATIVSFTGLVTGKRYYYRVRAVDSSGNEGPWTTPVWAEPGGDTGGASSDGLAPTAATSVTVRDATGFIWVKWNAISNPDPVTYEIFMGTSTSFVLDDTTKVGETDATFAVIKTDGANNPIPYDSARYFVVRGRDADGIGPSSAVSAAAHNRQTGSGDIAAGTITYESAIIASLDAGKITFGQMSGDRITANTISTGHIVTSGLDAAVVKFGQMHGDRITANTMDIGAIRTSTLTSRTITIGSGGQFVMGNTTNGVYIDQFGVRVFSGGSTKVHLSSDGGASFKGDITGASGTFSGTLRSAYMIGGQFMTSDNTGVERIVIDGFSTSGDQKRNRITFWSTNSSNPPAYLEVYNYIGQTTYGQVLYMSSGVGSSTVNNGHQRAGYLRLQPDYGGGSDGAMIGVENSPAGGMMFRASSSQGCYILYGDKEFTMQNDYYASMQYLNFTGYARISGRNYNNNYASLTVDYLFSGGDAGNDAVRIGSYLNLIGSGAGTADTSKPHIFASSGSVRIGMGGTGILYIQTNNASGYRPVYASAFTVQSTQESKTGVEKHTRGMAALRKVKPIKFKRKSDGKQAREVLGVVAEEIAVAIPEAAVYHVDDTTEMDMPVEPGMEADPNAPRKKVKVVMGSSEVGTGEPGELFGVDPMGLISAILAGVQELDARLDMIEKAGSKK